MRAFEGSAAGVPLSERPLSYDAPGQTDVHTSSVAGRPGYRWYDRSVPVGSGRASWEVASAAVLMWGVKTSSGFSVRSASGEVGGRVSPGARFWLSAHLGPVVVREPVVIGDVVQSPDRVGFSYGTLAGHPVSGEEAFIVSRRPDGSVWLTLRSATRPSSGRWRLVFPVLLVAQRWYRHRYVRALR